MSNARRLSGLTMSLVSAGVTAGTNATFNQATTSRCVIGGKFAVGLAAGNGQTSPTTDVNTGAAFLPMVDDEICVFVWGVIAAGTIAVAQGRIESTLVGATTTPGTVVVNPQFPALPDNFCPIAYTVVKTAPSSSGFTFGTTTWATSGIDDVWVDIATLPDRPQNA